MNPEMTAEERVLYHTVWAGLEVRDQVSLEREMILEYVRSSMRARRELPFAAEVPIELFRDYVLPIRVNNEYPDGSRGWLFEQLKDRVSAKSMMDAALEVNYWCFEQATYTSTDDRTISPLGICRRGAGRCGEESTLLVSALRAVGIPARQVYVPYWSHCDDNHAWVEFWADGEWHYMGACEPEPVPDVGWFQSAASRAMLVRSRVPDPEVKCGYRTVNSTALYAETRTLRVAVRKCGKAAPGVTVRFQIINESRLVTLHSEVTDGDGQVSMETGQGCLIVSAFWDGHLVEQPVDLRTEQEITLDWTSGFDPGAEERTDIWHLIPPDEKLPPYYESNDAHRQRLRICEGIRKDRQRANSRQSRWLEAAGGNREEIEAFLNLDVFSTEDKEALLGTLSEKDFFDVTCEALVDFLAEALRWKQAYPYEVWVSRVLNPRVDHEMLLRVRSAIRSQIEGAHLEAQEDVRLWMEKHIRPIPEFGLTDRRGNAAKYVEHRLCPESEWEILQVQICRGLGIPAAMGEYTQKTCRLTLRSEETLRWRENWSIARFEAGEYRLIDAPDGMLEPGSYCLITSRRQIDGSVSARAERFVLKGDREVNVVFEPDRTAQMLKSVPLMGKQEMPSVLLFLQPGAEPTEHLLLELLDLKDEWNAGKWPVRLLVQSERQTENATLRKVLSQLYAAEPGLFDPAEHYRVQSAMGIGDARLPMAVVLGSDGRGVYGCANYNIRTGQRLLQILRMIR